MDAKKQVLYNCIYTMAENSFAKVSLFLPHSNAMKTVSDRSRYPKRLPIYVNKPHFTVFRLVNSWEKSFYISEMLLVPLSRHCMHCISQLQYTHSPKGGCGRMEAVNCYRDGLRDELSVVRISAKKFEKCGQGKIPKWRRNTHFSLIGWILSE